MDWEGYGKITRKKDTEAVVIVVTRLVDRNNDRAVIVGSKSTHVKVDRLTHDRSLACNAQSAIRTSLFGSWPQFGLSFQAPTDSTHKFLESVCSTRWEPRLNTDPAQKYLESVGRLLSQVET